LSDNLTSVKLSTQTVRKLKGRPQELRASHLKTFFEPIPGPALVNIRVEHPHPQEPGGIAMVYIEASWDE
jgi:hypothetical protein